ncbi:TRAP transporter large permease subunit [Pollutimonas bauzanensis]|uniref:TRAP transporter large permease protein n=1 Tax=Pollutimonas bauzanensis TaxID=658167 RepID=A0A1M5UQ52_9BURK|nr:TRAP transporter large permease subunit [Pollutimonas bauzanensis]SHH65131.1 TRAP transporter, DctM subunit [Pollutimonas bauzanensis]
MTITVFVVSLLGAMLIGMPIAFSLLICGIALMVQLDNFDTQILAQNLLEGVNNYPLMAVPFFMLAGELMNAGGLSTRIVRVANAMVGHVRGGLGYVAILAATIVASISGSAVADSAAVAALLIPMMRNAGYNVPRSAGLIAAGGIIAPIIPPSIAIVIFGVAAQVSITKLFMAGIAPGLMMALTLSATWWICARKEPAAAAKRFHAPELASALTNGVWALFLPVVIIGGMKFGFFTPTEAAVVAVVYALVVGLFVHRELKISDLPRVMLAASKVSSTVLFLVACALVSAWLITIAEIPEQVAGLLAPFMHDPILLMFMIMALVIAVGTALDLIPTVMIMTPILMPIITQAGIDPVYFGVMFIMNNAIGLLTPPVGSVLNVVAGVSRHSLDSVIRGVWPFLLSLTALLFLFVLFPQLITTPARWFY